MKKLLIVIMLGLCVNTYAQHLKRDITVGFGAGLAVGSLNNLTPKESFFAGMAAGTLVGIVQESYQRNNTVDQTRAAVWSSMFGAMVGGIVSYHLKNHYWKNKEKKKKVFAY